MRNASTQSKGNAGNLRGEQDPEKHQDYRNGLGSIGEQSRFPGDQQVGTNRAIFQGNDAGNPGRIRPETHGGTLRCLIEDVRSQRRAISRKISRHQEDIVELQEELFRQNQREKTLLELLSNWQRNVEQITESGG